VTNVPFWKRKTLEQMSKAEWESLCDGCGRCCLNKLEEEGKPRIYFTDVACKLLDHETCRCKDYKHRMKKVPDCVLLTPAEVRGLDWLPPTCAYDLLAKGKDLYWWHPLLSGDPETVHQAGISVRGRVGACESQVPDEELEKWIVSWPGKLPKAAAQPAAPRSKAAAQPAAPRSKAAAQPAASNAKKAAAQRAAVPVKKAKA
jgi:uncharacterized cysteine cluster protein YcgN (CxxCxxCC family)